MTEKEVLNFSYTDFVGFINQWNVLPGAYDTLSKWRLFSGITNKSNILEIACTTGFSSRELATMTGCHGLGIDISDSSRRTAQNNLEVYAPGIDIKYKTCDAYKLKTKKTGDKYS
jgi:ubiquinone/menaquinone biosynthesis C-methylase UbiE